MGERHQLRAEMGKMIVDHLYLQRVVDKEGNSEDIDHPEFPDDEEVEYELRMRDIMDSSKSSELTIKKKLLTSPMESNTTQERGLASMMSDTTSIVSHRSLPPAAAIGDDASIPALASAQPRTLLDLKEENLLYKAEKEVSGRRVLITFYSETTKEDILNYSHNIRIVVACVQTLNVLVTQDFHEDTLEAICARRGKRHFMSATRESELVRELWDCLALQHHGQKITGITFATMDA